MFFSPKQPMRMLIQLVNFYILRIYSSSVRFLYKFRLLKVVLSTFVLRMSLFWEIRFKTKKNFGSDLTLKPIVFPGCHQGKFECKSAKALGTLWFNNNNWFAHYCVDSSILLPWRILFLGVVCFFCFFFKINWHKRPFIRITLAASIHMKIEFNNELDVIESINWME